MNKKIAKVLCCATIALVAVFCSLACSKATFARTVTEIQTAIMDKAVYQGVYKCYEKGFIKSKIDPLSDYTGIGSLMMNGLRDNENNVPLPTGVSSLKVFGDARYKVNDDGLSCSQLFEGGYYWAGGSNYSILSATGHTPPDRSQSEQLKVFLSNMGYVIKSNGSSSGNCYSLNFKNGNTNTVCRKDDATLEAVGYDNKKAGIFFRTENGGKKLCIFSQTGDFETDQNYRALNQCMNYDSSQGFDGEWLIGAAMEMCGGPSCAGQAIENSKNDAVSSQDNLADYSASVDGSLTNAALTAIKFLSGDDSYNTANSIKITDIEKRLLYQDYLTTYYDVEVQCNIDVDTDNMITGGFINWLDTSDMSKPTMKKCIVYMDGGGPSNKKPKNANKAVNGIDSGGNFSYGSIKDLDALLDEISKLETIYTDEELENATSVISSGIEGSDPSDAKKTCKNSGGAKSLGWIVCPILDWISEAVGTIYDDFVEPSLQLRPELFGNDSSNQGVVQAWEIFRNFANIVFIIILLVVIFSQLTGVGIDNYGIKKVLPKLITMAIMINLSYLICMVLVDVSNIVGSGVKSLLDNLGTSINGMTFTIDGGSAGSESYALGATAISGVGILTAVVAGGAVLANSAILLSLLVAAVGILVSIFFLFILMAAREAAIIVLVILSPLAAVCYILPNTKSMFDKWWKFFKGLLLVYPIVGLLVGGGDYVSRLLMTTGFADTGSGGSFVTAFTAMIVGIIPIFFIPTVLRDSFAAMGKFGGMISGFGSKARSAARSATSTSGKAIAATDTFRRARNAIGMHSITKRGRARAVQDAAALTKERSARNRLSNREGIQTRMRSIAASEEAKAVDEFISQRLSLMQSAGTEGGIWMDGLDANGNRTGRMERGAYTLENMTTRMRQLEEDSRGRALSSQEQTELAALARGMAGMKGGAGQLSSIIREAGITRDNQGNVTGASLNRNFMSAMGEIYSRDATVKSKMNEKDMGASIYTEQFMTGGKGAKGEMTETFDGFKQGTDYSNGMSNRVKTYEAGLRQSGAAFDEYLTSLNEDDCQRIMDDEQLLNSLDVKDRSKFLDYAAGRGNYARNGQNAWRVERRSARDVNIINPQGGQGGQNGQGGQGGQNGQGGQGGQNGQGGQGGTT